MSKLRELAYRLDPVLWVREVLQTIPTSWQETYLRSPRGAALLVSDRAAGRQDHGGGLGHRPYDGVLSTIVVGDRVPSATTERRSGTAGARGAVEGRTKATKR